MHQINKYHRFSNRYDIIINKQTSLDSSNQKHCMSRVRWPLADETLFPRDSLFRAVWDETMMACDSDDTMRPGPITSDDAIDIFNRIAQNSHAQMSRMTLGYEMWDDDVGVDDTDYDQSHTSRSQSTSIGVPMSREDRVFADAIIQNVASHQSHQSHQSHPSARQTTAQHPRDSKRTDSKRTDSKRTDSNAPAQPRPHETRDTTRAASTSATSTTISNMLKCVICIDESCKVDTLCLPCSHLCMGSSCADALKAAHIDDVGYVFPCPVCRLHVKGTIIVHSG